MVRNDTMCGVDEIDLADEAGTKQVLGDAEADASLARTGSNERHGAWMQKIFKIANGHGTHRG